MFSIKKEQSPKLDLLMKENILLNCKARSREEVIREAGEMLYKSGYVKEGYIEGMRKRELSFSTHVGNGIAMPHGVEEVKHDIITSGIVIMIFPEGTNWGEDIVNVVIGIAGVGEEHLSILANVAGRLSTPEEVARLINGSVEEVYEVLTGEE